MKSVYIAAAIGTMIASSSSVNAQCVCAPTDSACLSDCGKTINIEQCVNVIKSNKHHQQKVGRTNSCISECQSNNDCYQSCISMHWPGADPNQQFSEMMPSSTWMSNSNSWSATATSSSWSSASWSSQYPSSSWNSYATPTIASWSSQWPSYSAWPSGVTWSRKYYYPFY